MTSRRAETHAAAGRLLGAAGWQAPHPDVLPSGTEFIAEYLTLLA